MSPLQELRQSLRLIVLDWRPLALWLVLQLPSFRKIFKYAPYPEIIALLLSLLALVGYAWVLAGGPRARSFLARLKDFRVAAVLLLAISVINFVLYPIADGAKFMGLGWTGDDALIEPVRSLLAGQGMYDARLYDGVPISPGPGWILLNAPFANYDWYFLLTPAYLGVTAYVLARVAGGWHVPNLFLLGLCSSISFWEVMVNGHDLIALSCALLLVVLLSHTHAHGAKWGMLLGGMAGVLATARVVFAPLPILLGLLLLRSRRVAGWSLILTGMAVCLALHGVFYHLSAWYQPLHLFHRAQSYMGVPVAIVGGIASFVVLWRVIRQVDDSLSSWLGGFALCVSVPMGFVAFGELAAMGFRIVKWEGAHYLLFLSPLVLSAILLGRETGWLRDRG